MKMIVFILIALGSITSSFAKDFFQAKIKFSVGYSTLESKTKLMAKEVGILRWSLDKEICELTIRSEKIPCEMYNYSPYSDYFSFSFDDTTQLKVLEALNVDTSAIDTRRTNRLNFNSHGFDLSNFNAAYHIQTTYDTSNSHESYKLKMKIKSYKQN